MHLSVARESFKVSSGRTGRAQPNWRHAGPRATVTHSVLKEAFQDLNRVRQIAVIAARHGFADTIERSGAWRILGRKEKVEVTPEAQRASTARRFRMFLNDLGPTFIKLGQILSTRQDLLPREYIDELAQLQDHVPPMSHEEMERQLRTALGRDPADLFRTIDPEPLAAASIAQVHRAVTLAGDEVVIKVQRSGITERIRSDLSVLHYVARLLEAVVEETGLLTPTGIVEEFDKAIHEELDFLHEAQNIREFYANHLDRPYLKVPRVFDELCTRTVLTLEFIRGTKISQIDLQHRDRHAIARHLIEASFRQLFEDGVFHGDPHPGNIFVLDDDTVALIDYGIVGRLTRPMQQTLIQLILAIALKDPDSVARILYRIGTPDARANLIGFRNDIDAILNQYLPSSIGQINATRLLSELFDLAVKYRIRMPREYALLSRASISMEGILRWLAPDLKISEVALPYAKQLFAGQYDPSNLQGGLLRTVMRLQSFANDLPVQVSQILMDLESGRSVVNVRSDQMDRLNANLRAFAVVAFMGLVACGLIIGAFISFASHPWEVKGVPVMGALAIALTGALVGAVTTWMLFGGRLRKIRLARFLNRSR
ncbi:MAG: AarF/ABC1/UbiB kinase family protein [Myxococcaceae bacterium]|nr:AarF/ABC1/UbiB kinase family protein [Myxococcaceae bacterium]